MPRINFLGYDTVFETYQRKPKDAHSQPCEYHWLWHHLC